MSNEEKSDRDLLIELSTDVKWLKCIFEKHLTAHSKLFWSSVGVVITVLTGLFFVIVNQ